MGYESPGPHSQRSKRMRTSFKHHQLRTMKSYFALNQNPDAKDLKQLAQKTGLSKRVLQVRCDLHGLTPHEALGSYIDSMVWCEDQLSRRGFVELHKFRFVVSRRCERSVRTHDFCSR